MSLNDFPTRDDNSVLATRAEMSFERLLAEVSRFVATQRDRKSTRKRFAICIRQEKRGRFEATMPTRKEPRKAEYWRRE